MGKNSEIVSSRWFKEPESIKKAGERGTVSIPLSDFDTLRLQAAIITSINTVEFRNALDTAIGVMEGQGESERELLKNFLMELEKQAWD